ncbi:unnamed protein product [Acanthoscelides obtectus]|uniref:Uncharacterized protein n=1 Tax=Acanthoscelides obtectus TaxID=200917 RepID=A0A9P0JM62_ACAOB|nr:unnamed protein product [Acanthoscelides obtectus]CAK1628989.1 hypothetical protein AOBTE_LOCUS5512 [Acanthoscelides obtectus]
MWTLLGGELRALRQPEDIAAVYFLCLWLLMIVHYYMHYYFGEPTFRRMLDLGDGQQFDVMFQMN